MKILGNNKNLIIRLLGVAAMAFLLAGCAALTKPAPEAPPETGSLIRTFTLIDEQGRTSGTLVISPHGGMELRDVDGKLVGTFKPQAPAPGVSVPQQEGKE